MFRLLFPFAFRWFSPLKNCHWAQLEPETFEDLRCHCFYALINSSAPISSLSAPDDRMKTRRRWSATSQNSRKICSRSKTLPRLAVNEGWRISSLWPTGQLTSASQFDVKMIVNVNAASILCKEKPWPPGWIPCRALCQMPSPPPPPFCRKLVVSKKSSPVSSGMCDCVNMMNPLRFVSRTACKRRLNSISLTPTGNKIQVCIKANWQIYCSLPSRAKNWRVRQRIRLACKGLKLTGRWLMDWMVSHADCEIYWKDFVPFGIRS